MQFNQSRPFFEIRVMFIFSIKFTVKRYAIKLAISGFEPRSSGFRSDGSAKSTAITAHNEEDL